MTDDWERKSSIRAEIEFTEGNKGYEEERPRTFNHSQEETEEAEAGKNNGIRHLHPAADGCYQA